MQMTEEQFNIIKAQLKKLVAIPDGFYAKKFAGIDIDAIKDQSDFEKLPFTDKGDLREAYPLGIAAVPTDQIVRIHSSSGTTGTPVIIPYTKKDVADWAIQFARCYEYAGVTKEDRVHITPGYGLWTAGIGFQAGCELLGAMAIPMGPGNTDKQLKMMIDHLNGKDIVTLFVEEIAKRGIGDQIRLRKGIIGSERWGEKMRRRIANELGVELYDIYGLTGIEVRAQRGGGCDISRSSTPSPGSPFPTVNRARSCSPRCRRKVLLLSASARTTFPASCRASVPAGITSIRVSTSLPVAPTTWSRCTA